ncbi:MAG: M23 family metallopeptidase [Gammaproteobacteria bacterium]|nr:M23 family metallopeptidase [Gammaproteobacteria bacterium]
MAPRRHFGSWLAVPLAVLTLVACGSAAAQSLYKYRDANGDWVYTDRAPAAAAEVEVRRLNLALPRATMKVTQERFGDELRLVAHNGLHAPIEVGLVINASTGVRGAREGELLRWVVAARGSRVLMRLPLEQGTAAPQVDFHYDYMPGDPNAVHSATNGYRAPFVSAANYPITQAFPDNVTHQSPDSEYAIDIAMPVGTDVLAARGGIVFDVIGTNYSGGTDREAHLHSANIVRILHDDGTFAVYAHLNWNSIRVRPGERVQAGQYIADSGNTGFSSGPHLHFAVQRNAGMRIEALPVAFEGPSSRSIVPATGNVLTAYP